MTLVARRRAALQATRGYAESLTDLDSPYSIQPLAKTMVATAKIIDRVVDAFKTGRGVPWRITAWSPRGPGRLQRPG
jgi:hypothetical protein